MPGHRKSRATEKFNSPSKSKHNSNHVRIIGGEWRGRKLGFPDIDGLRPTGDRMRETLFNWLSTHTPGAAVIDLFAGSGSLGFESLSRGASQVTFVEMNRQAVKSIEQNLRLLGTANGLLRHQSAVDYLQSSKAQSCDLLFLDPPFADKAHHEMLTLIDAQQIMKPGAYLYIEAPSSTPIALPANWTVRREKTSGQVRYLLCHC